MFCCSHFLNMLNILCCFIVKTKQCSLCTEVISVKTGKQHMNFGLICSFGSSFYSPAEVIEERRVTYLLKSKSIVECFACSRAHRHQNRWAACRQNEGVYIRSFTDEASSYYTACENDPAHACSSLLLVKHTINHCSHITVNI